MATIKSFRALRPDVKFVESVAALPYDVVGLEEAKNSIKRYPYSFLQIDKPELHMTCSNEDEEYVYVRRLLKQLILEKVFIQDEEEALYIYGLTNNLGSQYGIVGLVSAMEYEQGIIKKHENTRTDKELERIKHISHCQAHTGPIFLAYKGMDRITKWMEDYRSENNAIYSFITEDGVKHEVFKIDKIQDISYITECFKQVNALYIADGHHRAAAAVAIAKSERETGVYSPDSQYFLAVIFPKDQLHIMGYHRILQDESGLTPEELMKRLKNRFTVEPANTIYYKPDKPGCIGMRYHKKWYKLILKKEISETKKLRASLDVSILQDEILEPIFHIKNPKEDSRIEFIGGVDGDRRLNEETEKKWDIAFSLYPTSMEELITIADHNQLMPPKSTWFEPKLRSGIFIHLL